MSNKVQSLDLDNPNQPNQQQDGPVECLGKTFENDQARREYYLAILAVKLKDPEFRKIEGFPIGEDEDILNLSDPPYYTACPNPFIEEFIAFYGRPYDPNEKYKREPYATDVSEGKTDPIYNAHSYHTKVPHKAIMHYILHYTNPGDLVFDGFCGSGMTGVAAQMCGDRAAVESIGYKVLPDGTILKEETDEVTGKSQWSGFSKLGARNVLLNDLGAAAAFIASQYNSSLNPTKLEYVANELVNKADKLIGWMYKTKHSDGRLGHINFTIWSDVFICPECSGEIVFWDEAIDLTTANVRDNFPCPHCNTSVNKKSLNRFWETRFDKILNKVVKVTKQVPVLINYSLENASKRYEKKPDTDDFNILSSIEDMILDHWYPVSELPAGDKTSEPISNGTTNVNLFYTKRNLAALSQIYGLIDNPALRFLFTAAIGGLSKLNQFHLKNYVFGGGGCNPGPRKGVIYTPSISLENPPIKVLRDRLKTQVRAFQAKSPVENFNYLVSVGSATELTVSHTYESSLDYIFIDPPFGSNLMYSELSFTLEAWLKVFTNNKKEAIENRTQRKNVDDYRKLMTESFTQLYKLLKPGRWMTIEFSNTQSHVWNNIQTAIFDAGFIVANVSALDKKQGGMNAIVGSTAVKQDLVISAYKPNGGFEDRFIKESDDDGVWDFIRTHLGYLPIIKRDGNELVKVPERDPRILFDQVVAYFVRNMRDVPLSSREFQDGLQERFSERDGMVFLPEQVAQYDKARMTSTQLRQLNIFVDDEASAIEWLRQLLNDKPQTYQDIHPKFINELSGWKKAEMQLELMKLLEQNFLKFNGQGLVPAQIHSYLSTNFQDLRGLEKDDPQLLKKAKDRWFVPDPNNEEQLQALRERDLLKQFEEYKSFIGKKIKLVRLEAVRAGFKKAWQDREYATIIQVAEKIPEDLLQEDQKLLMWYDQAQTRYSDSNLF